MAIYQHKCRVCNHITENQLREAGQSCSSCGATTRRVFSFQYGRAALNARQWNYAVGAHVSSDREFREALKRRAEENSVKTGMAHDYEPVYPGDMPNVPYPEHDQVLDDRAKTLHDAAVK